jgi:sigma-B regulation protein RsbU (phosphoserine phosphatase)
VLPSSLFYAVMDAPTGLVLFVNAGHPRPYLCDRAAGTAVPLGSHDLLLGIEEYEPVEMCHTFVFGERLALYTDGVSDAVNAEGECFGQRRLRGLIVGHRGEEPEAAAEAVIAEVERFRRGARQRDDESIVIIDRV